MQFFASVSGARADPASFEGEGKPLRPADRTRRLVTLALASVFAALLVVALVVSPWEQVWRALVAADPWWLGLAVASSVLVFPLWVVQWRHIAAPLAKVGWPVMTRVVAMSATARFTISGLGGVASGGAALHAHAGLTPGGAAGVMTVDQLVAGGAKLVVLLLAVAIAPLPYVASSAIVGLVAGCAALLIVIAVLIRLRPARLGWMAGAGWLSSIISAVVRLGQDLARLNTARVLVVAALLALVKKGLEIGAIYAIQLSLHIEGTVALAILATASVSLVTLLPLAPAHLGPQGVAVFSTYAALGVPTSQAVSAGLLLHAVMMITAVLIGAVAIAVPNAASRARSQE